MNDWKTTLTGIGSALTLGLTFLASLSYQFGDVADVFPPEWKKWVMLGGLLATVILKSMNAVYQADAAVPRGHKP